MFTRLSSYISTLLLALPMCWGCMLQALPATPAQGEKACLSCHPTGTAGETPASDARDCLCCVAADQRNLSPDIAEAPRPILSTASVPPWTQAETLSLPLQQAPRTQPPRLPDRARACDPPLYHRHCALLI